jgi:hypothetical protein
MIVPTIGASADANLLHCRLVTKIDTLFEGMTSQSKICSVNSYISVKEGNTSRVVTLEEPDPGYLIQVRCWRTPNIQDVPDIEKLKHAYATAHFFCGENSAIHHQLEEVLFQMAEETMAKGGHTYVNK